MSFKEDFESTVEIWKRSSLPWKVVTSVGFLAGSISLLSIGDTVFAYRGVLSGVVEYYRLILTPISDVLARIYDLGAYDVDALVLSSMLWMAFGRMLAKRGESDPSDWLSSFAVSLTFIAASLAILIYLHWGVLLGTTLITVWGLFLVLRDPSEPLEERRENRIVLEYFGGQILLAFFLIAILEGLMRPLL